MDNIREKRNSGEQAALSTRASESIQANPVRVQQVPDKKEIKEFLGQVKSLCEAMNNLEIIEPTNLNPEIAMQLKQTKESGHEASVGKTLNAALATDRIIKEDNLQNSDDIDKLKKSLSEVIESYAEMASYGITNLRGTLLVNASILDMHDKAQKISKNYQLADSQTALENVSTCKLNKILDIQKNSQQTLDKVRDGLQTLSNRIHQHIPDVNQELFSDGEDMNDEFINSLEDDMISWINSKSEYVKQLMDHNTETIQTIINLAVEGGLYHLVVNLIKISGKETQGFSEELVVAIKNVNLYNSFGNQDKLKTKIDAFKVNRKVYGPLLTAVQKRAEWEAARYSVHWIEKNKGIEAANELI